MAPRVLILTGDFVEDYEIRSPFDGLLMVGAHVDVVAPKKKKGDIIRTCVHDFEGDDTYTEKRGHNFVLNASIADVDVSNYDGLVIPGGRAPEYIRMHDDVLAIVRRFSEQKKPMAATCHGVQVLAAADVLRGRSCTAYPACKFDVAAAGGTYKEVAMDGVHVDGNLITAPAWPANGPWIRKFLEALGTTFVHAK